MRNLSRQLLLIILGLFILKSEAKSRPLTGLKFLVVGDWGDGSDGQRKVAKQMARTARALNADFVISTGDNFYPRGIRDIYDPAWTNLFEKIYDAPALDIPWYVTLGNHDHKGNVEGQIKYSKRSSRWKMPANYYVIRRSVTPNVFSDFFFLDTKPIKSRYNSWLPSLGRDIQITWLERALAESDATWKIVVGHHPVYSSGKHGNTEALEHLLSPLFKKYGVLAYFNGHDHNLEHIVSGGTHFFTSGAGANTRRARKTIGSRFVTGSDRGFIAAHLTDKALTIKFHDDTGGTLHTTTLRLGRLMESSHK